MFSRYLRATIAPNIREKRKDKIKNSIKPSSDEEIDLDGFLSSLFLKLVTVSENGISEASFFSLGFVGQFSGPLDELNIGVVIAVENNDCLQLYEGKPYGFIPCGREPQSLSEWTLVEEIEHF